MIIEIRDLADAPWKGDRQASGWIIFAEQGYSDGLAAKFPRIPGFQNRRDMIGRPCDAKRMSVLQHQYHWLAGADNGFQKIFLLARKIQIRPVKSFAGNLQPFTQSKN